MHFKDVIPLTIDQFNKFREKAKEYNEEYEEWLEDFIDYLERENNQPAVDTEGV